MAPARAAHPALEGARVLVLGGTSGFGRQVAQEAAEAGAKVIVVGRDKARLEQAVTALRETGAAVGGAALDVAQPAAVEALAAQIGQVDHVVSMLGSAMSGGFASAPWDDIQGAVQAKLFDNLRVARAIAPVIAEGGSLTFTAGTGGTPDNSSGAFLGNEAIATMVRGLAVELAPKARVNAVSPTWTLTGLWRDLDPATLEETATQMAGVIPLGRTATVAEVASAYLFLMESTFVTGHTLPVDGGMALV